MLADLGSRRRPLLGVAGALLVASLTVSGCAAGQNAQTVEQTSVVDGTGFTAGDVIGRDFGLRPPSGASYAVGANAVFEGYLVNQGDAADKLVSVSSPIATSVVFYTDGVSALLGTAASGGASGSSSGVGTPSGSGTPSDATPSGSASETGSASATASPSDTGSAGSTASASGTASVTGSPGTSSSAAAAPAPLEQIPLPSNRSLQFGYTNDQPTIVFLGLTKALFPAQSFPVTFTFANGGTVTATFSVKLPVDSTLDAPTISTEESEGSGE